MVLCGTKSTISYSFVPILLLNTNAYLLYSVVKFLNLVTLPSAIFTMVSALFPKLSALLITCSGDISLSNNSPLVVNSILKGLDSKFTLDLNVVLSVITS